LPLLSAAISCENATDMKKPDEIREWLRRALEETGLTVSDLAARAGVHKATIHRAMSDDYNFVPSRRTISRLEQAIDAVVGPARMAPSMPDSLRESLQLGDDLRQLVIALNLLGTSLFNCLVKAVTKEELSVILDTENIPALATLAKILGLMAPDTTERAILLWDLFQHAKSLPDGTFTFRESPERFRRLLSGTEVSPDMVGFAIVIWAASMAVALGETPPDHADK
jgi:transcriptional regulator with XRE-family HTH domain